MRNFKITICNTRLPALMDQTRLLGESGFIRDGHIELTFLADTIGPRLIYTQRLTKREPKTQTPPAVKHNQEKPTQ